jgi:hypothetical protein
MTKCLIMPDCNSSLLPVDTVCRELGLKFEVDQGGGSGRFSKDGATVVELSASGDLLVVPETEQLACVLCEGEEAMHAEVLAVDESASDSGSAEPAWMRQHQIEGHPYDKRCPWCVQGKLKQRQHFRQLPGSSDVVRVCQVGGCR